MKTLIPFLTLCAVLGSQAWAQSSQEDLQKYVSVLPSVKASFWEIDPKLGYAVKNVGGGVYVMSDNGWQSSFLVTEEGVIVFDAPARLRKEYSVGNFKGDRQADQDAYLLSRTQGSHRRLSGVQEHQRSQDRRARYSRRLPERNERSESVVAECNVQNGEDAHAWRPDCRTHPARLPLE